MVGIKAVITANGDVKSLEKPAQAIERWGKLFPNLFPAGSDTGTTKAAGAVRCAAWPTRTSAGSSAARIAQIQRASRVISSPIVTCA